MRKQYRKQIYSYPLSRSDESHFRTDARLCAQKKQACGTCLYSYTYCCLMLLCASLCGASFRPEFLCCGIKCNFTLSIPYFNCYVNVFSHLFYIFCLGESPELFMVSLQTNYRNCRRNIRPRSCEAILHGLLRTYRGKFPIGEPEYFLPRARSHRSKRLFSPNYLH